MQSYLTRIRFVYMIGKILPTWFDQYIMGWPMALGRDLQAPLEQEERLLSLITHRPSTHADGGPARYMLPSWASTPSDHTRRMVRRVPTGRMQGLP